MHNINKKIHNALKNMWYDIIRNINKKIESKCLQTLTKKMQLNMNRSIKHIVGVQGVQQRSSELTTIWQ